MREIRRSGAGPGKSIRSVVPNAAGGPVRAREGRYPAAVGPARAVAGVQRRGAEGDAGPVLTAGRAGRPSSRAWWREVGHVTLRALERGRRAGSKVPGHRRAAGGRAAGQQHRPGRGDLGHERAGVEGPVQQHQHARARQGQQPAGQAGLVPASRAADRRAGQRRVPVSASVISRSTGYPARPCR